MPFRKNFTVNRAPWPRRVRGVGVLAGLLGLVALLAAGQAYLVGAMRGAAPAWLDSLAGVLPT